MKFIKNYFIPLILKLTVLFKLINSNELSKNNTKLLKQRSDYLPGQSCVPSIGCVYSTNLECNKTTHKCDCKSGYKWNSDESICLKKCDNLYQCDGYYRYCLNDMCACKYGYKENNGICKSEDECTFDSDCPSSKPRCSYSYSYTTKKCQYDEYSYSYSWAYYLWFLILIPIAIVVTTVYCICRRRVTPGAVIISNNRVITQTYGQQQQQFPPPPPPYAESNTYRY